MSMTLSDVSQLPKKSSDIREAAFRHQNLTIQKVEVLLRKFDHLRALDLSYNRLDNIPHGLPRTLVALDLSFNNFTSVPPSARLGGLVELKLSNNRIESIVGLFVAISLEHLDLSNNLISAVEGLESLQHLKTLNLENNNISSDSAIRPLSFNTQLTDLYLAGNPISQSPSYKTIVLSYAVSIRRLDGRLMARPTSLTKREGYSEMYNERQADGDYSRRRAAKPMLSISTSDSEYLDASADKAGALSFDQMGHPGRGSGSGSGLPWREPPNPMPRPHRGKQIFDTAPRDPRPVDVRVNAMDQHISRSNSAPHYSPSSAQLSSPVSPKGNSGRTASSVIQKPAWQSPYKSYHNAKTRELAERMSYKVSTDPEPRRSDRLGYSMAYSHSEPSVSAALRRDELDYTDNNMNNYNDDYFEDHHSRSNSRGRERGRDPSTVYTHNSRVSVPASARRRSLSPTASLMSSPRSRSRSRSRSASACRYIPSITVDVGYGPQLYHPGIDPSLVDLGPGIKPLSPCLENKAAVLRNLWAQEGQRELDRYEEEEEYLRSVPIVESVDWNRLHHGGAGRSPASLAAGGASPGERSRSNSRGRTRFFSDSDDNVSCSAISTVSGLRANPNGLSPKYRYDGSRTSSRERAPRAVTPRSSGGLSAGSLSPRSPRYSSSSSRFFPEPEYDEEVSFRGTGSAAAAASIDLGSPYARLRRLQERLERSEGGGDGGARYNINVNDYDDGDDGQEVADDGGYYPSDQYVDSRSQPQVQDDRMPPANGPRHDEEQPPTSTSSRRATAAAAPAPAPSALSSSYEQLREPAGSHSQQSQSQSQASSQASSPSKSQQLSLSDAAMHALAILEKSNDFKDFEKLLGLVAAPEDDATTPAPGFNAREWGIRLGLNGANPMATVAEAPDGSLVPMSTENASESDQLKLVMLKLMQRRKESLKQLQEAKLFS